MKRLIRRIVWNCGGSQIPDPVHTQHFFSARAQAGPHGSNVIRPALWHLMLDDSQRRFNQALNRRVSLVTVAADRKLHTDVISTHFCEIPSAYCFV